MTYKSHFPHIPKLFLLLTVLFCSSHIIAQPLDKISGVVGKNRIILQSEIDIQVENIKQQNPGAGENLHCDIMEQMILQKLKKELCARVEFT